MTITAKEYGKLFHLAIRLARALHDEIKESGNPSEATNEVLKEADDFFGPEIEKDKKMKLSDMLKDGWELSIVWWKEKHCFRAFTINHKPLQTFGASGKTITQAMNNLIMKLEKE